MSEKKDAGLIDAGNRITQELLQTPRFKEGVKILLKAIDPESAPELVKTLMWQDPELFLAVAGVIPDMVNAGILGGKEVLVQIEKLPPPLLTEFLAVFTEKLNGKALGALFREGADLCRRVSDIEDSSLQISAVVLKKDLKDGFANVGESAGASLLEIIAPLIGSYITHLATAASQEGSETNLFIKGLTETIAGAVQENPAFISHVYRPLQDAFNGVAVKEKPKSPPPAKKTAAPKTKAKSGSKAGSTAKKGAKKKTAPKKSTGK